MKDKLRIVELEINLYRAKKEIDHLTEKLDSLYEQLNDEKEENMKLQFQLLDMDKMLKENNNEDN